MMDIEERNRLVGALVGPFVAKLTDKYVIQKYEADPTKRNYIRLGAGVVTSGLALLKETGRFYGMPRWLQYMAVTYGAENLAEATIGKEGLVLAEELGEPEAEISKLRKIVDTLRAENARLKAELKQKGAKTTASTKVSAPPAPVVKSAADFEKEMGMI